MWEVGRILLIEHSWALQRELIRSTPWGGFSATTLWGCPTRKYHSWFSLWRGFDRYEIIPQMQEELHLREGRFLLTTQYFHQKLAWEGYRHLQSFRGGVVWRWIYHIGSLSVEKALYISPSEPLWVLRYRFSEGVLFRWIPLWAARWWHTLRSSPVEIKHQGDRLILPDQITLHYRVSPTPRFIPWSYPYQGVYYPEEARRGYEATETLYANECWEWRLHKADEITIALSPEGSPPAVISIPEKRPFHMSLSQTLHEAAEEFFLKDDSGEYIIAGHPWFSVWGRDTFISLPGLTLARGEEGRFHRVMETALKYLSPDGQFPNTFPDSYAAEDTALWLVWCLLQAEKMGLASSLLWQRYGEAVLQILVGYLHRLGGRDGLLHVGRSSTPSWMDAVVDGKPVVERRGALVELNALWYAALRFVEAHAPEEGIRWRWGLLARKVLEAYKPTFWDKSRGYLADWNAADAISWQIRPNQLFAAALPSRPISDKIAELIVDTVERHLLTPRGVRSLSPADPQYRGKYMGDQRSRDLAYHNGTVWLWLLGPYADAKLALWGDAARGPLLRLLQGLEEALYTYGWGTLAEIYEGDAPHAPRGAPAQAWSVAEVLRIAYLLRAL